MDLYVACHRISRNPEGRKEFTGRFNEDGEPIVRALPERILPGAVFRPTDATERSELLAQGAARPLTSDEQTLYESGLQTEFPPSLTEPPTFGRQRAS